MSKSLLNLTAINKDNTDNKNIAEILSNTQKGLGFVPNMYAEMSNSETLIGAYTSAYNYLRKSSILSMKEQEVVLLSVSQLNECNYCMAAHSFVGEKMSGLSEEELQTIRKGDKLQDSKLAALQQFTVKMMQKRGWIDQHDLEVFIESGYTKKHVLDVIAAIGIKTMSNYFNHLNQTNLDDVFKDHAWKKANA